MTSHTTIARIVDLLPTPRAELAAALGVSEPTLRGWLRVAAGEELPARAHGRAEPSAEIIAAARALLVAHQADVAAALGEPANTQAATLAALADAEEALTRARQAAQGYVLTRRA